MGFNQLPENYDGPQKRRTEFESEAAKLTYDAQGLIAKAKRQSARLGKPVDPITFAQREDDDLKALQAAIDKEQGTVKPAVDAVMAEAEPSAATGAAEPGAIAPQAEPIPAAELSPEQIWFVEFQARFNAFPKLHPGIEWVDVERSLRADPEARRRLQAFDEKGHKMNVFGEKRGKFIFVSAWNDYREVASDHRNIAYDREGQELAEQKGRKPNGNAVSIIAGIMGVAEDRAVGIIARIMGAAKDKACNYLADPKFHEQLVRVIPINGLAWLKTDAATRAASNALRSHHEGVCTSSVSNYFDDGSFRAVLMVRVKKA